LAVHLRLRRIGRKRVPIYKLVATDSRAPRDGRFIEALGTYKPLVQPMELVVKEPRLFYWLGKGALPSDTVRTLLTRKGIWLRWSLMKKGADEATITMELQKWQSMQEAKLAREIERKARRVTAHRKMRKEKPAPTTLEVVQPEDEAKPASSEEAKEKAE
jgi:small subunit ribosomal protein S16